jgi:hypothetical protein
MHASMMVTYRYFTASIHVSFRCSDVLKQQRAVKRDSPVDLKSSGAEDEEIDPSWRGLINGLWCRRLPKDSDKVECVFRGANHQRAGQPHGHIFIG